MSEKQQNKIIKKHGIEYWILHTDYETRVEYWMKHTGYECLAGEPREMTDEIIRRLLAREMLEDDDDGK